MIYFKKRATGEINKNRLIESTRFEILQSNGMEEYSVKSLRYSVHSYRLCDAEELQRRAERLPFIRSTQIITVERGYLIVITTFPFPLNFSKIFQMSRKIIKLAVWYLSSYKSWEISPIDASISSPSF